LITKNIHVDVISTQKQLNRKKGVALCKKVRVKEVVKCRWPARKSCDSKSVAKIVMTIQVN